MLNVQQIQKTTCRSARKRLQIFVALLLLFVQSLFAVNESGNLNVGNGQYVSRATDITWTSGSISLNGGTLEIFGDFTINSGVGFNFNNNSTLIVHGDFTYSVGDFQLNSGQIRIDENFILSQRAIEINNGSSLIVGGNISTASTITINNGTIDITGNCTTTNLNVNNGSSIHAGGSLTSSGTITVNNGLIDIDGDLLGNNVVLNNTSLFIVDGDFTQTGNLTVNSGSVDLLIAGNYSSSGTTTIWNNGDIYVFGTTTGCSGNGCSQIDNLTNWVSQNPPPGQAYVTVSSGSVTYTTSGTFTVPAGVTQITVQAWGGGGKGGSTSWNNHQCGGGGGGAYSSSLLSVTPGTYTVTVGVGSTTTSSGGDSWFSSTSTLLAKGGNSVADNNTNGATGGLASAGVGTTKFSGGNGADGIPAPTKHGGGGGSSAGTSANGITATNINGAVAPSGGGNGGNGSNDGSIAYPGSLPGGGGGGAAAKNNPVSGGAGANGQVIISWSDCTPPATPTAGSNSPICAGSTLTLTASTISSATYSWTGPNGFTSSTQNPSITNATAAASGTYSVTATVSGCTSSAGTTSVTVVDQPTAPPITRNPDVNNVCAGQTLTATTSAGSGGTGTIADQYRYSTDNGNNWSAWSTSVPNFAAVVGTNIIQSRRTADGTGCYTSASNQVSWNVVPQPTAPPITRNPDVNNVCAGQTLTATTSAGSGGTGTIADEYRYSIDNGNNWSAWSTSVPNFAAVVGTNIIQSRRTADGTGCNTSASNQVSWNVVPQPTAPPITRNPDVNNVCAGQTLTATTSAGSGGTGTIADEYRYSTDNGNNWSAWSTSLPNFAAVVGTNIIQSRRTADGTGCYTSASNQVSWNVVPQPTAPPITRNPDINNVCAGQTLTATTSAGSGGTGTIADEYRYSIDNGNNWSAWSTSVPNFAAVVGTNIIQSRRTADGTGCYTSASNQVSWNVVPQPTAPPITRNPDVNNVCAGQPLTATTSAGSGGTGTIADQYRYSTDNGNNWSAWSTSVPNFAAVVGTNIIQSRRTADGTGCSTSASNQVSWNVVPQPTAPTINTKTPNLTSVCQGNGVSATFNAGSGGVGCSDDYILIIDGGVPVAYTPSSTVGTTATSSIVIQGRRANCTSGAGCTSTAYSTLVSWNINSPTVTISTDYVEDCPELDPAQGFNPQSGNYDAGSTKLVFEVSLSGTTSAIWSFNYAIGGTGVSVRTSGVPSPNYPQSDSVSNTTSNPVVLTFYINNNPPVELYPSLTISYITDANGCSATNVSSSVTIKAMPDVGDYE